MPTEHKRKKNEPTKIAADKKLNIKSEPNELHPLSFYVDDSVELIRQVFSCLKSTSIKSIAPEFLKDKSIETLQEYCLDELIGISKKRLLSVINATKCPSDTETSDSEIEPVNEHISLEEISSDTDDEKLKRNVKLTKKNKKKSIATGGGGGGGASGGTSGSSGAKNDKPKAATKEYSVLELLELQARARAIRSQLALEPVIKIELDSDNASSSSSTTSTTKEIKEKLPVPKTSTPDKPKPIKLKRNFRKAKSASEDNDSDKDDEEESHDDDGDDDDNVDDDVDKNKANNHKVNVNNNKAEENTKSNENGPSNKPSIIQQQPQQQQPERSPTPDIVPIIKIPETLVISSESENENDEIRKQGKTSSNSYINLSNINVNASGPRTETEDEIFLRKIKEGNLNKMDKANATNASSSSSPPPPLTTTAPSSLTEKSPENKDMDIEEGEIDDVTEENEVVNSIVNEHLPEEDELKGEEVEPSEKTIEDDNNLIETDNPKVIENEPDKENEENIIIRIGDSVEKESIKKEDIIIEKKIKKKKLTNTKSKPKKSSNTECKQKNESILEIIDDDDIIDLGKDVDLDFSEEKLDQPQPEQQQQQNASELLSDVDAKEKSNEIEYKNNSDDETNESWNSRYFRCKKVVQVLEGIKLDNKLRKRRKVTGTKLSAAKMSSPSTTDAIDSNSIIISEKETTNELLQLLNAEEEGSVKHYEVLSKQNLNNNNNNNNNNTTNDNDNIKNNTNDNDNTNDNANSITEE